MTLEKQNARNTQWNVLKMKKVSNTDINKLNWRFNHIFVVITNRDFYCMLLYNRSRSIYWIFYAGLLSFDGC